MKKIGIEIKWGAIITTFYCIWAYIENATGNHKDFSNIIIFGLLFILILILMSIMAFFDKKINLKIGDKLWRNYDVAFEKELEKSVKRQIGVNIIIEKPKTAKISKNDVKF